MLSLTKAPPGIKSQQQCQHLTLLNSIELIGSSREVHNSHSGATAPKQSMLYCILIRANDRHQPLLFVSILDSVNHSEH